MLLRYCRAREKNLLVAIIAGFTIQLFGVVLYRTESCEEEEEEVYIGAHLVIYAHLQLDPHSAIKALHSQYTASSIYTWLF